MSKMMQSYDRDIFLRTCEKMEPKESVAALWNIFPEHSRTFAFTTQRLRDCGGTEYEADVLMWAYSLCRLLDTLSDHKIDKDARRDDEKRESLSYIFVNALKNRDVRMAVSAVTFMKEIHVEKHGYKKLIEHAPILIIAGDAFSEQSRASILGHLEEMAEGFSNPKVREIKTLEDQLRAYYFDAQKPGRMINDLWAEMGHFNHILPEERDQMVRWGDSLAIVLQGINDYNDWKKDIRNGKPKFPLEDFVQRVGGVEKYEDLLKSENAARALAVLDVQRRLILEHYEPSLRYCENLPTVPIIGPRVFCWDALAFATANMREMGNPEKALSDKEHKLSREEIYDIDKKVTVIAETDGNIRPFIAHLFKKTSQEYEL